MANKRRKLKRFYAGLDRMVEEMLDEEFAAEVRRVRKALVD